jgi:hypothetical protein
MLLFRNHSFYPKNGYLLRQISSLVPLDIASKEVGIVSKENQVNTRTSEESGKEVKRIREDALAGSIETS